jgi:hypothetical protein
MTGAVIASGRYHHDTFSPRDLCGPCERVALPISRGGRAVTEVDDLDVHSILGAVLNNPI